MDGHTGDGFCVVADRSGLTPVDGGLRVGPGVVFGLVTEAEATRLVDRLAVADDPGTVVPEVPWAAVVRRRDGEVVATCSTIYRSGLFLSVTQTAQGPRLVVATDPERVVRNRGVPTELDEVFLDELSQHRADPRGTPFVGVSRVLGGDTMSWDPRSGQFVHREWCGPATLPDATVDDPEFIHEYVRAFDEVVAELARRSGPPWILVSGGLDSTFVAATLALVTEPDVVIQGWCYRPLPEANLAPVGSRVPDEWPMVQALTDHYPGKLEIHPLRNDAHIHPLDAAASASERSWLPVNSPGNQLWINQFYDELSRAGITASFIGANGNAAFSATRMQTSTRRLTARQRLAVLRGADVRRGITRGEYLTWLTGRTGLYGAATHPRARAGSITIDPFLARPIWQMAASLSPSLWRHFGHRGWAREAGRGRVPEIIRTWEMRGGQGWDAAHAYHFVRKTQPPRMTAVVIDSGITGRHESASNNQAFDHILLRETALREYASRIPGQLQNLH